MKYRSVGASGLKVSEVSIGGWVTFGGTIEDKMADTVLRTAIEGGINFIDLADVYARGEAEKIAGRTLRDLDRDKLIISSKVFGAMSDDPNDRGLSRKHILQSVDRSLANLGLDFLDMYFCHREDPDTPLEETAAAMDHLVQQGKILYWGTSVWPAESLERAYEVAYDRRLFAPVVEQPRYSLLHREIEREVMPTAKRLGMGLVAWSPLAGGMLTGKYNDGVPEGSRAKTTGWLNKDLNERNLDRIRSFCGFAEELSVEPGQLALAWLLQREELTSVITGASSPEQVLSNVKATQIEIPDEVNQEIEVLFPVEGELPVNE